MKLSEFAEGLWKQVSKEEIDLERQVLSANVYIQLKGKDNKIYIHKWEYEARR